MTVNSVAGIVPRGNAQPSTKEHVEATRMAEGAGPTISDTSCFVEQLKFACQLRLKLC